MKKYLITTAVVFVALCAAWPAHAQSNLKIGVFDPLRISEETVEGKRVQAALEKFLESKQAALTAKEQELTNLQQQLQTQALSLSEEKRVALEREIQRKVLDLNSARESAMAEWNLERNEAQGQFEQQLARVIAEFGRREGFSLLLARTQVAYAAEATDVTTALVDLFNQMVKPAADGS